MWAAALGVSGVLVCVALALSSASGSAHRTGLLSPVSHQPSMTFGMWGLSGDDGADRAAAPLHRLEPRVPSPVAHHAQHQHLSSTASAKPSKGSVQIAKNIANDLGLTSSSSSKAKAVASIMRELRGGSFLSQLPAPLDTGSLPSFTHQRVGGAKKFPDVELGWLHKVSESSLSAHAKKDMRKLAKIKDKMTKQANAEVLKAHVDAKTAAINEYKVALPEIGVLIPKAVKSAKPSKAAGHGKVAAKGH